MAEIKGKAIRREAGTIWRFAIVGVINTVVGCSIMFGLYNIAGWGYWLSSATNFFFTSILSYVLNKKFTFRHSGEVAGSLLRFAINIGSCYLIAYGIAKPVTGFCLKALVEEHGGVLLSASAIDNVAMAVGLVLFTVLNYLGQRLFAFRKAR